MTPEVAAYGSWTSPITAEALARDSVALADPELRDGWVWWIESRPAEDGREVIVRARPDGSARADVIPPGFSARTRVHEYGGGSLAVHNGIVFFSNDDDGRVYRLEPGDEPEPISPDPATERSLRYADFEVSPDGARVYCVRESHEGEGEAANELVWLSAEGAEQPRVVATGSDFYAAPRVSPDGSALAWLSWDHPRMPWEGTELWTAPLDSGAGAVPEPTLVAGGPTEAILQPGWSPDGRLHWVSDVSGWWNLYREGEPLHAAAMEFGMPMWVFGQAMYAFLDDGRIACAWSSRGFSHVGVLDPRTGELTELDLPYVPVVRSARLRTDGRSLAFVGASPTRAAAVVVVDVADRDVRVVAESVADQPDAGYLSEPEPIEFESGGRVAHALFYPPRNRDYDAPSDERPPLLVMSHGGPTGQAEPILDLEVQFWTSRGFAVADVNYAGSTGYGREYRDLLHHNWGLYDLEDCAGAALHVAREGLVDGDRLAIRGGSAGGYTTLCALTFTDVFDVGASYFGIADVEPLFEDTHKFESRYDDWLIPRAEMPKRSPIHFVDRISAPVIIFQGLDDPVVPPSQAELIVGALAERGIEHEYHAYEDETHGFRKAETIIHSLQAELAFYGRVLGFDPAP